MELRHLRYFAAVAEYLSFSKAAEALHISQPPLSRQIQELEKELGVTLFDRRSKKTELTKAGEYMKVEVGRILESVELVARSARAIGEADSRSLRVGCVNFLMYSVLPPFFERLRESEPEMKLEISIMSTEAQEKALLAGSLDIGFVRSWIEGGGLVFDPLSEESLAVIYPAASSAGEDPASCIESLRGQPFIAISPTTAPGLSERIKSICSGYGCSPEVGYVCSDAFSIIKLVGTGLGWSIVPDMAYRGAAATADGVGITMLPQSVVLGLCYAKSKPSELEARFIARAKDFFAARNPPVRREAAVDTMLPLA
jgi:Transcriptional regulator